MDYEGMNRLWGSQLRVGPMKRDQEGLLVKVPFSCSRRSKHFGDGSTMGWSPKSAAAMEWSQLESRKQAVCATEWGDGEWLKPLEKPRRSWVNPRYWALRYLYCWSLALLCFSALDDISQSDNILNLILLFTRTHSWKILNFKKREIRYFKDSEVLQHLNL